MESGGNLLVQLLAEYPAFAVVLAFVGFLRLVMKPFLSLLHQYVNITVTKKDNDMLHKIEASKAWKVFLYCLDWFGSIKVIKPPKF